MAGLRQTFSGMLLTFLAVAAAAQAQEGSSLSPRIDELRVGFAGKYKVGLWTPVLVQVSGGNNPVRGRWELVVPDSDGIETRLTFEDVGEVEIPAGRQSTFMLYLRTGRVQGGLTVEFIPSTGPRLSRHFPTAASPEAGQIPPALLASQQLVVTIGHAVGVEETARRQQRRDAERTISAVVENGSELPNRWHGYEGIDTLILTTSRPEIYKALGPARRDAVLSAIAQWVRLGGKLIVSAGSDAEGLLAEDGPLARFAPGRLVRTAIERSTSKLETFAEASQRLDLIAGPAGKPYPLSVAVLEAPRGRVEVFEGSEPAARPLVVRFPYGLGQVIFVAVDLDRPPVSLWKDRPRLVGKLLELGAGQQRQDSSTPQLSQVVHVGYEDLAGQLRAALDQFRGVTLVAFSWVATLIVVYMVLVGPGDYFFLRRFVGRMEWTWLSFALIVIAFCSLAWFLATRWKAAELKFNQVDLVDVDVADSLIRGTTWTHVYSPQTQAFDLTLKPELPMAANEPPFEPDGVWLSWQGLPGAALGGMNTTASTDLLADTYRLVFNSPQGQPDRRLAIEGMPVEVWSTKSLVGRWWGTSPLRIEAKLSASREGLLRGEITNPLPERLIQCFVYYDRWAYELDELSPGQSVRLDQLSPRNLEWLLTERTVIDVKDISTPWDRAGDDVPRIMRMMMFHEAAGGRDYTDLVHRYQGYVDLSAQLKLGRAMLVGRTSAPASRLARDGQSLQPEYDRTWTFYRFVIPVAAATEAAP